MKISYSWLKEYFDTDLDLSKIAELLTDCGLEVESISPFQSIKGGLAGLVIGEIKEIKPHPNADKLRLTKVDIGVGDNLNIVCGAPNIEVGQKVIVAQINSKLFPIKGEPIEIKKSKIRGEVSEGMICAEDEIGFGDSHEGVIILDKNAKVGTSAKEYYGIEEDTIFEIGLTPNRSDAASHCGVARDLHAVVVSRNLNDKNSSLKLPTVDSFKIEKSPTLIQVEVKNYNACPRYSGIVISNVNVKESPAWLQNRLKSIGVKPINNIVDVTNFVLHECGQPLHAFDVDQIKGNTILVKNSKLGEKFTTLDEVERTLTGEELMICNKEEAMAIAGVFGGLKSGIKPTTKNIFIESAYFNPTNIRRTSKLHGIKTEASFHYERGADPNITLYALKRSALLIKELAGGYISSDIIDLYPEQILNSQIKFNYNNLNKLLGVKIEKERVQNILRLLEIEIISEDSENLMLSVPSYRVDVKREVDVIEEILRIYGCNNIPMAYDLKIPLRQAGIQNKKEKAQNVTSTYLSDIGFYEIISNSLTTSNYIKDNEEIEKSCVRILNPLSSDLNIMRFSMLFSGLESIAYNKNRKSSDLKIYEFGHTYSTAKESYKESYHLSLFVSGSRNPESWSAPSVDSNFYYLKSIVFNIIHKLGISFRTIKAEVKSAENTYYDELFVLSFNNSTIVELGKVRKQYLKQFDISQEVFYADFNWDIITALLKNKIVYEEVSKFPEVRRDLALVLDKNITYSEIENIAFQTEKHLLKSVNLFDVYEGEKIGVGKKSYAISLVFQDKNKTLNEAQIENIMNKLIENFKKNIGANIRS